MESYIKVIFTVCVTAAIIKMAAPESSLTKYLQMLCSLCAIAVIAVPIYQLASDTDAIMSLVDNFEVETENYEEIYKSYLVNGELENAERVLSEELCSALGADKASLYVHLNAEYSAGETELISADVLIYPSGITVSPEQIRSYIKERLSVECRIIYA